jgi:hypothetical protein
MSVLLIDGYSLVQLIVERNKPNAPKLTRGEWLFRNEVHTHVISKELFVFLWLCCGAVVRRCGALRQTSVYLVLFARSLFPHTSSLSCISLLYTTIYAGSCWCHLLLQHFGSSP